MTYFDLNLKILENLGDRMMYYLFVNFTLRAIHFLFNIDIRTSCDFHRWLRG